MTDALARTSGGSSWLVAPSNMNEAFRFAETIARSDLAPKDFRNKPENVLVAIQLGAEVGLSPMQALQNISVINGRPSIWGDAQLALVRAHPSVVGYTEAYDKPSQTWTCTLRRQARDGQIETTVGEFSFADAQRAKLATKQGPWTEYPKRMIQMRARSFCLRDGAADILKGLAQREEAEDIPAVVVTPAEQQRVAAATPALPPAPPPPPAAPANTQQQRPLPTKTTAKYPVAGCADKPFTELSDGELTEYIAYYSEKLPGLTQPNHREAVQATIHAAERELERRIEEEGQPLAADAESDDALDHPPADEPAAEGGIDYDPETGEVREPSDDELAEKLAKSVELAKSGLLYGDTNEAYGLTGVDAPANQTNVRKSRKGAA